MPREAPFRSARYRPPVARESPLLVAAYVVACLAFVVGLADTAPRGLGAVPPQPRPVPATVVDRDGRIELTVHDEAGHAVRGAEARAMLIRDGKAYLAAAATTDAEGRAILDRLPRGEHWILAERAGRARASTRVVVEGGTRAAEVTLAPARRLEVVVQDDGGAAVPRASIEVRTGDPLPFVATTGDDGRARFERLGPPPWTVRARAVGYDESSHSGVKGDGPLKVVLKRLGSIDVAVVGADGRPARGATVLAVGPGLWPARKTETGPDGHARIAGLGRGIYDLRATRGDEVVRGPVTITLPRGGAEEATLSLVRGRRIEVRVTDGEGDDAEPVPSASIVLAENGLSSFPIEGTTDKRGVALLGPIAPVNAVVSARAEGFVARTGVAVPASGPASVAVALVRGAALTGEVVDGRGDPVGGATIEVIGTDTNGGPIDETNEAMAFRAAHFAWALSGPREMIHAGELGVMPGPIPPIPHGASAVPDALLRQGGSAPPPEPWVTRGDGTFRAAPVPPGRVRAIVRHPAYVEAVSELVTTSSGGEAHVKVVLHGGGTLEGRVLDDRSRPVAGARVDVAALRGTLERTTITADDGTFGFAALPSDVVVTVMRPDAAFDIAWRDKVSIREDERKSIDITLPALRDTMTVHVTDEHRDPLDNAQVSVLSLSPKAPLRRTLFTGEDGTVALADAVGLKVRVEVSLPGRAPVVRQLDEAPAELTIELAPGITVNGSVTARRGHDPVAGAEVTLYGSVATRHARTDDEGHFRLDDVPPGSARLVVVHAGHARAERPLAIEAPSHERPVELDPIDLADAGTIEGKVVDRRGEPVAGARVAKDAVPTYVPVGAPPDGIAVTDRKGRFRLKDLPEGELTLEAYAADLGRAKLGGVKVAAGRTTDDVTIVLDGKAGDDDSSAPGGVAVTLGERAAEGSPEIVVVMVATGSEAERAGLEPGDRIASIDGQAPASMADARARLAGPLGDDVVLEVERADGSHTFRVVREAVHR